MADEQPPPDDGQASSADEFVPPSFDELPGTLDLGAFSVSLAVADLARSRSFYETLGFVVVGGDADEHWLILKNGETTLGLFEGLFPDNILTFNPGLDARMGRVADFLDVREIQARLDDAGIELERRVDDDSTHGPASITLIDPDGNPILIDQFF